MKLRLTGGAPLAGGSPGSDQPVMDPISCQGGTGLELKRAGNLGNFEVFRN